MHGGEGEDRKRKRHMLPVPPRTATVGNSSPSDEACFCKDGRKISIGDCALFQAEDSPPFVGIIRSLTASKEDHPKLCVNWLYRPADVKLGKGNLLDAAPNEVFYSFHKDEIPASFLLHPCKVAFLRKGVELPPGISSFVCRRVYDTANKCLWWLTDKDYINEWQEEVDQLLDKTRLEMYAEGRTPKPLNSPASSQQLKSGSDTVPNSASPFPSQVKGKKRERNDPGLEPIKRERLSRVDDGESGYTRSENMIKSEVSKIIDKEGGGLVNLEGVEKLVQLMQSDKPEKKIDLAGRIMLADVIAATDRFDCLSKFVQLRGLPVLDDWLQEAHKGKAGDNSSPREGDKGVEELLLALLRALDKLPVNLHALQSCNIGKSVNHLRNHKNFEIHKKAKSLVDTWKKRVEAEMKSNDAKSGTGQVVSWPVSHSGGKRTGSSDILKSSISQPAATKTSNKLGHGESVVKSTSASPGSVKLSPPASAAGSKDSYSKVAATGGTSDLPLPAIKEEKSSSSSQSQNNSQSCSSDHAKVAGSAWKEDARSSTAGSMTKASGSSSRHRKSSNGFLGSGASGVLKESGGGKSGSANRSMASDKTPQSGITSEKTSDALLGEHVNSQRLIVRLPNPGKSPAQSVNGGSFEDVAVTGSRASSPGMSDKLDHGERKPKGKGDASRGTTTPEVNNESWQSNDVKDGLAGLDEGDRSPLAAFDDEQSRNSEDACKVVDASKTICSSSGNEKRVFAPESKYTKPYDASFSSINALIESCVKYSEIPSSLSGGDDLGMNLLASVAAGEISNSPLQEDSNNEKDSRSRSSQDNLDAQEHSQQDEIADADSEKRGNDSLEVKHDMSHSLVDDKQSTDMTEKSLGVGELHQSEEVCAKPDGKPTVDGPPAESNGVVSSDTPLAQATESSLTGDHKQCSGKRKVSSSEEDPDGFMDVKKKPKISSALEKVNFDTSREKVVNNGPTRLEVDNSSNHSTKRDTKEESLSSPPGETDAVGKVHSKVEGILDEDSKEGKQPAIAASCVPSENGGEDASFVPGSVIITCPDDADKSKPESAKGLEGKSVKEQNSSDMVLNCQKVDSVGGKTDPKEGEPMVLNQEEMGPEEKSRGKILVDQQCISASGEKASLTLGKGTEQIPKGSEEEGVPKENASAAEPSGLEVIAMADAKIDFDLNEGFPADDGNQDETVSVSSSTAHNAMQLNSSTIPSGMTTSITVASAAKGSVVPPDNMLRNKGDIRWKGSAATSAFRRAEPRKLPEVPVAAAEASLYDSSSGKQVRLPLDIDLNMPDERVLEDVASQCTASQQSGSEQGVKPLASETLCAEPSRSAGRLDLDLNRAEEGPENGQPVGTSTRRLEMLLLSARPSSSSGGLSNGEHAARDFDLNNGPSVDDSGADPIPRYAPSKGGVGPYLPPIANLRMNTEPGNLSSWFPPGGSFPPVSLPPFVADRTEQPFPIVAAAGGVQRILGSTSGAAIAYGADMYRAPVLSSSPAISFPAPNAYPYPSFQFGGGFPLASTSFAAGSTCMESSSGGGPCFPPATAQLVGPGAAVSTPFGRPYLISHQDAPGMDGSRKWPRQGLDLNAGPGTTETDSRDERFLAMRPLPVANSQALTEEQVKIYQAASSAALKRRDPEGGWDTERFGYKQPSWQ
ncbi:uncharacterized protein LOC116251658 [Nymphaea colorata]|nr:uncharacterized protein LOC116251658 [Nymphaea colorata]